jgi:RNA polymerase sigma factor (sigma-70 family)
MSDYRIKVSIRNNRLLKAMETKGFNSASKFERSYGFCNYTMINLINGSTPPLDKNGEIKPFVKEILDILEINITDAFTKKQLQGFKKHSFTVEAKESQLLQLVDARKPLEINLMENDVNKLIDNLLSSLPKKYEQVIRMSMFENKTTKEIADILKVGKTRVGQIILKGIEKLKTHSNFDKLIESGAIDLFNSTQFKKPEKSYAFFNPKKTLPPDVVDQMNWVFKETFLENK